MSDSKRLRQKSEPFPDIKEWGDSEHSCLKDLRDDLSPKEYNTWIKPIQYEELENHIKILAPNSFVFDILLEKYANLVTKAIKNHFNNNFEITFEIGSNRITNNLSKARKNRHSLENQDCKNLHLTHL